MLNLNVRILTCQRGSKSPRISSMISFFSLNKTLSFLWGLTALCALLFLLSDREESFAAAAKVSQSPIKKETSANNSEINESGQNGENKLLPAAQRPAPELEQKLNQAFMGNRKPGFSPIELEWERTADGRIRIRSVDPNGPYSGIVKENQEFKSLADIPQPKSH